MATSSSVTMSLNEYLTNRKQAPYLQEPQHEEKSAIGAPSTRSQKQSSAQQEADAAAGGAASFTRRVSSFSLMPRVQSTETVSRPADKHSDTGEKEKGNANTKGTENLLPKHNSFEPDWRLRDRMKTIGVGLVLALNIGTDPPDITKPHPCAVLECWIDPRSVSRSKAKEIIGERLEMQYAKWQLVRTARTLKHRRALDPTIEDVRSLCVQMRRQARNERILLHYNGHGVPRPTANGEIWVFDKNHTEYIPLSILDLRTWMEKPSIVVLDCSAAGILIPFFKTPLEHDDQQSEPDVTNTETDDMESLSSQWVNDTIVLCGCSENEWLPMGPDYPADIFTSCLTTPIPIALRWFVRNHPTSMEGLDPDAVDAIPGKANDRKTPLGELNWIFTAVTDSIAWNMLPKPVFQRLFRQDLLVASMFRNFLLADRILRSLGCTPISHPPLPPGMAEHPLWRAWDLVCETLIFQLMRDGVLSNNVLVRPAKSPGDDESEPIEAATPSAQPSPPTETESNYTASSPFFSEQLTAFEVWLDFASIHRQQLVSGKFESPEQLPVVLQVLLSQVHRVRALILLRRFLQLGPWAVNQALSLGIFPYVMKLLQSPEYKSLLVSIWTSVLSFDPTCRIDLLKDGAFHHFVHHLTYGLNNGIEDGADAAKERTQAAFILSICCEDHPAGQAECLRLNLLNNCYTLLSMMDQGEKAHDPQIETHFPSTFRFWLLLCLGNLFKDNRPAQIDAFRVGMASSLFNRFKDNDPEVRAAACYAVGCLVKMAKKTSQATSHQDLISERLPQHNNLATAGGNLGPSLVIPGPSQAQQGSGMQLQPTFQQKSNVPQSNIPNLRWRPQGVNSVTSPDQKRHPLAVPSTQQFFSQSTHFSTPHGQMMQVSHVTHQQPMQLNPQLVSPAAFLAGGSHGHGIMHAAFSTPNIPTVPGEARAMNSLYDDSHTLGLDLNALAVLLHAAKDPSLLVRYEAVVSIALSVAKYKEAFVAVAEERSVNNSPVSPHKHGKKVGDLTYPRMLDSSSFDKFRTIWDTLRSIQHQEPHPSIAAAANSIVSFVHENLLHFRMQTEDQRSQVVEKSSNSAFLTGIDEERSEVKTPPSTRERATEQAKTTLGKPKKHALRRVLSDGVDDLESSMEQHALLGAASSHRLQSGSELKTFEPTTYSLPESEIYAWKKSTFVVDFLSDNEDVVKNEYDPLSPIGATKANRATAIANTLYQANHLGNYFASLAPKPPKPTRQSIEMLLEQEEEALEAAEEEASAKKKQLELTESKIFKNDRMNMTTMLRFHQFDGILASCGGTCTVALWDTEKGAKVTSFENGNLEGSRMTTCGWINEEYSSMFYVGCDDGTVRFWGGLPHGYNTAPTSPMLMSAFHALPMKAGERGSGLVCEWQQWSGNLLAGGNAKTINCWDLESESLRCEIETESEGNVTTLTTAWDSTQDVQSGHWNGFGPETLVAGFSDGLLRIFDLRTHRPVQLLDSSPQPATQHSRRRQMLFKEHKSWVVSTAFTGYANRYEIISGTVDGEIKAWDLRMSSSIRTVEVQRSTMTAFAVHSRIPVVATGSHAQFIKVLTLDGDTLQVLRYHEKMASHRIGPVSCLAFHKHKPLLAAGSTDSFIGLYTTKKPIVLER